MNKIKEWLETRKRKYREFNEACVLIKKMGTLAYREMVLKEAGIESNKTGSPVNHGLNKTGQYYEKESEMRQKMGSDARDRMKANNEYTRNIRKQQRRRY